MADEAMATRDPAYAEIQDMMSGADGQKEFIDWLANPVTRKLIMAARNMAKPRALDTGVTAEYLLGESIGANKIIDFMISPSAYVPRAPQAPMKPQYGAKGILKEQEA